MLRSGDKIGPYTLINKLGSGAFGVVWLAERRTQIATTTAAVKIPLDEDINLESIKHEADLWVRASGHPNVLPIIEANVYDEHIIIASEYAPDGSLEAYLKKYGRAPSVESAVEIVSGILAGLEHLHSRNIIHRDLKPANILFQGDTPRLADFGISRVLKSTSQSITVAGTPSYMAPEAFDGKRNEQTDIWSVGVIFYQLLAGHLPFAGEDITSLLGAILSHDPKPLPASIPASLQNIIDRTLAKNPKQRYKSAAEMRADLRKPQTTDQIFQAEKSVFTVKSRKNTFPPKSIQLQSEKKNNTPHFIYAIAGLLAVVIIVSGMIFLFKSSATTDSTTGNKTINNRSNEQPEKREWTITVPGNVIWKDTGIRVQQGTRLYISASGTVTWATDRIPKWTIVGPDGSSPPNKEDFPIPHVGIGSLVMRIGNVKYAVGANKSIEVKESGTIELMVNDDILTDNSGSFTVNIKY